MKIKFRGSNNETNKSKLFPKFCCKLCNCNSHLTDFNQVNGSKEIFQKTRFTLGNYSTSRDNIQKNPYRIPTSVSTAWPGAHTVAVSIYIIYIRVHLIWWSPWDTDNRLNKKRNRLYLEAEAGEELAFPSLQSFKEFWSSSHVKDSRKSLLHSKFLRITFSVCFCPLFSLVQNATYLNEIINAFPTRLWWIRSSLSNSGFFWLISAIHSSIA